MLFILYVHEDDQNLTWGNSSSFEICNLSLLTFECVGKNKYGGFDQRISHCMIMSNKCLLFHLLRCYGMHLAHALYINPTQCWNFNQLLQPLVAKPQSSRVRCEVNRESTQILACVFI